jgi:hypothetical protein
MSHLTSRTVVPWCLAILCHALPLVDEPRFVGPDTWFSGLDDLMEGRPAAGRGLCLTQPARA